MKTRWHHRSKSRVRYNVWRGICKTGEIIDLGVDFDIIKKAGSWFSYGETRLGQGREAVRQLLTDNPELQAEIEEKVVKALETAPLDE